VESNVAQRVVIIGGGFGGLHAAKTFGDPHIEITLCDRRNFHLFQPLLYQVATGGLSPADISSPLRGVLKNRRHVTTLLTNVRAIDLTMRAVSTSVGNLEYDSLIVATGNGNHYFGNDHWRPIAPGLKTIEDAIEIRCRILTAFESAEAETDPIRREHLMTFLIVGAGPTGVELAGAMGEIALHTLKREFRNINSSCARIVLIEGGSRVLSSLPESLSGKAMHYLHRLGVEGITDTTVTNIETGKATLRRDGHTQEMIAGTIIWAAGVRASSIGKCIAAGNQELLDETGRVIVEPDLSVPGHPEVFVIGDLAHYRHQTGAPLPLLAPVAMQQGRYVAKLIQRRLRGKTSKPFRYRDKGNLATIGRAAAVGVIGQLRVWGYPAWLTWLFIHLMYLVEFENRVLVFIQWFWSYITRNRGARLITPRTHGGKKSLAATSSSSYNPDSDKSYS
jgi:NADH dehydrogenase